MNRTTLPIMHLAGQTARQRPRTTVSNFDFVFILTMALMVITGCFLMLELASARSSGHESSMLKLLAQGFGFLSAVSTVIGQYVLLFVACITNSALIVLLVQGLRIMDRKVRCRTSVLAPGGYMAPKKAVNVKSKAAHVRRESEARKTSPFLLSPVFR